MLYGIEIGEGEEEPKSYLVLHGSKTLQAMQYDIGDELKIILTGRLITKEKSERNSVSMKRMIEFEVKDIEVEVPLKTKLKEAKF